MFTGYFAAGAGTDVGRGGVAVATRNITEILSLSAGHVWFQPTLGANGGSTAANSSEG